MYSKSCEIENWRSLIWEIIHVSSTTSKDLIETRSRLDQREWWIGSTVDQQPEGKVFHSFEEKFNTQRLPNQSKTNLGSTRTTWGHARCVCCSRWNVPLTWDRWKNFHEKVCVSDGSGPPEITLSVIEARILSENIRVNQITMEQGNLLSKAVEMQTQWKNNVSLKKIVILRHSTRTTWTENLSSASWISSRFQITIIRRTITPNPLWEDVRGLRVLQCELTQEEM